MVIFFTKMIAILLLIGIVCGQIEKPLSNPIASDSQIPESEFLNKDVVTMEKVLL